MFRWGRIHSSSICPRASHLRSRACLFIAPRCRHRRRSPRGRDPFPRARATCAQYAGSIPRGAGPNLMCHHGSSRPIVIPRARMDGLSGLIHEVAVAMFTEESLLAELVGRELSSVVCPRLPAVRRKRNDIFDIGFVGHAVVYCDAVLSDKDCRRYVVDRGIDRRSGTTMLQGLDGRMEWLA
jgi:hypothetical protein